MKPSELVNRFYNDIWNARNYRIAEEVLASDLSFRGSLGPESTGIEAFIAYAESVHKALSSYTCEIKDLVESDRNTCAARMMFTGKHTGEFLGHAPSFLQINWAGAAFFKIEQSRICEIWVLGDLYSLHQQLTLVDKT